MYVVSKQLIRVAARSKASVCGCSAAGITGSSPTNNMDFCLLCVRVLSRRGLSVGLITRPEASYQVWRVWVWSWSIDYEKALAH